MKRTKLVTSALILGMAMAMTAPVQAANVKDKTFKKTYITSSDWYNTNLEYKENNTSHYIHNESVFDFNVLSMDEKRNNNTYRGHAIIPAGTERFIYNWIYEKRTSSRPKCYLHITTRYSGAKGYVQGCWSPDSVGKYPVANP